MKVRTVEITPSTKWGGQGIIGCQILNGMLARIPKPTSTFNEPVVKPLLNASLVLSNQDSREYIIEEVKSSEDETKPTIDFPSSKLESLPVS